jgi:hypothetical protein
MQEEVQKEVIKVEPVKEEPLFYENGDVVLGRCRNTPIWPCIVQKFLGYDEEEVQVYQVTFLGSNFEANLETYNLIPITKTKLDRMKKNRIYRGSRGVDQTSYMKAIREAEIRIERYKRAVDKDYFSMGRFLKLYCSDSDTHQTFIEVERIKQLPPLQVLLSRRKQARKLDISPYFSASIEILSPSETHVSAILT